MVAAPLSSVDSPFRSEPHRVGLIELDWRGVATILTGTRCARGAMLQGRRSGLRKQEDWWRMRLARDKAAFFAIQDPCCRLFAGSHPSTGGHRSNRRGESRD